MSSNITKADLISICSKNTGESKAVTEKVINSFLEAIQGSLEEGRFITLVNFGSFVVADRQERQGRNPKTGEPLTIPASRVLKFKPGKGLKEAVQG